MIRWSRILRRPVRVVPTEATEPRNLEFFGAHANLIMGYHPMGLDLVMRAQRLTPGEIRMAAREAAQARLRQLLNDAGQLVSTMCYESEGHNGLADKELVEWMGLEDPCDVLESSTRRTSCGASGASSPPKSSTSEG